MDAAVRGQFLAIEPRRRMSDKGINVDRGYDGVASPVERTIFRASVHHGHCPVRNGDHRQFCDGNLRRSDVVFWIRPEFGFHSTGLASVSHINRWAFRLASLSMFSCATDSKSFPNSWATAPTYQSTSPSSSDNTSESGSVPARKCFFSLLASSPVSPHNASVAYVRPPIPPVPGYTAVPRDCF